MPLKKGMVNADVCLKKNIVPLKILDHCKWPPEMMVPLKCMAASAPLKTVRFKLKYRSNTLYICNLWL